MADFNEADIEAAKRRVQEMRSRASRFTAEETPQKRSKPQSSNSVNSNTAKEEADSRINENNNCSSKEESNENDEAVQDKSLVIILALILILSKEGADSKLILALLYLLL